MEIKRAHPLWKTIRDDLEKPNSHMVEGPAMPAPLERATKKLAHAHRQTRAGMMFPAAPSTGTKDWKHLTVPRRANKW